MNESDLIKSIINGIGSPEGGRVYVEDIKGNRTSAVNLGYDTNGDVIININGRIK